MTAKKYTYRVSPELAENYEKFLQILAHTNSVARACKFANIGRSIVYHRRQQDPAFKKAWDNAIDASVEELEYALRTRAVQGVEEPVYHQGEICGFKTVYSDSNGQFLLRGQKPEKYGNKVEIKSEELADLVDLMTAANSRLAVVNAQESQEERGSEENQEQNHKQDQIPEVVESFREDAYEYDATCDTDNAVDLILAEAENGN